MPLDLMLGSEGEEAKIGVTFRADFNSLRTSGVRCRPRTQRHADEPPIPAVR